MFLQLLQQSCAVIVANNLQDCHNIAALFYSPGDDIENKSRLDKCHTSGKKKKKKRRRKDDSSGSDTECASTQKDSKCGEKSSPRLVEELPDIIPKQVKPHKNKVRLECYHVPSVLLLI